VPPARRFEFVDRVLERLSRAPGVTAAAFTSEQPLTPGGSTSGFQMRSKRDPSVGMIQVQASPRVVAPHVFAALGMRIVAGRGFTDEDTDASTPVVVVNQAFARRYLGPSPIGEVIPAAAYSNQATEVTVIGIVQDVRYVTAADASQPEMYYTYRQLHGQLPVPVVTLLLKTSGDPAALAPALRSAVREADPHVVPEGVLPLDQRLLTALARPRLYAILLGGFAAFALAIAAVGLFGALSYSVVQRSRELAVRAALGATRAELVRQVVVQGMLVTVAGLGAGLVGSLWLTRLLSAQLYGISRYDAVTYAGVASVLLAVALVACIAPARRAARLDPLIVLREG
jgi:predicted permease